MMDFEEIRKRFADNTSCHGIAQIYLSKKPYQRRFWGILVTLILITVTYQVSVRIAAFLEHKTTVSITEKYTDTLEMPGITICNFNNYFDITSQQENDAIDELAKAKSEIVTESLNMTKIDYFNEVYDGSIREFTINKGWNLSESIIWCLYGGEFCSIDNFTYVITDMGKCWSFQPSFPVRRAGSRHGLYMVLDVKSDEYTETYLYGNWGVGIKVQIHSRDDEPEVDRYGLAIPIGLMGLLTVKATEEKIMFTPWGECKPNLEDLDYYEKYSNANCFNECFRELIELECECHLYYHDSSPEVSECSPREMAFCLNNATNWLKQNLTPNLCKCQPPCHSWRYDGKISYSALPDKAIVREDGGNIYLEGYTKNYVGLTVYFEKMSYTKIEEDKAISESAFLSDLGGQLGLWIGISVVTIFEFFQFVVLSTRALYRTRHNVQVRGEDRGQEEDQGQEERN